MIGSPARSDVPPGDDASCRRRAGDDSALERRFGFAPDWREDGASLRCGLELRDDTARILPVGELDIDTVPAVDALLEDARAAGMGHVILDLRQTTFIDSTALRLAVTWHRRACRERFGFALVHGPDPVRRVIEIAGLAEALEFVD